MMDHGDWNNILVIVGSLWVSYVGHIRTKIIDLKDLNNFIVNIGSLLVSYVGHPRIGMMDRLRTKMTLY
jgi:hypothetical protein